MALGGEDDLVPNPLKGVADLFLTVAVRAGSVKIIHAAVHSLPQQIGGLLLGDTLNGQAAEAIFLDLDAGTAQSNRSHRYSSLSLWIMLPGLY